MNNSNNSNNPNSNQEPQQPQKNSELKPNKVPAPTPEQSVSMSFDTANFSQHKKD